MKAKRIFALLGIIFILLWIIATLILSFAPIPARETLFPIFVAGCVIFPIMLWIILWMISFISGKKNIASYTTKEMDEIREKAEKIKYSQKESSKEPQSEENEENAQSDQ